MSSRRRFLHRPIALACLALLAGCSEALGFDDVQFGGNAEDEGGGDARADAPDSSADAHADQKSPGDGASPKPDATTSDATSEAAGDVTSPVCGDLQCSPGETCTSCPGDCGACPATCGNGTCDPGESCSNCPSECGACPPVCGNGPCESGEDCSNCPGDCGACPPVCGNGACEAGETCGSCVADCVVSTCPAPPAGLQNGAGLLPIDVCAFPMNDTKTWSSYDAVIAGLGSAVPVRSVSDVLGDLNRQGTSVSSVPGLSNVHRGMKWEQGDVDVTYWIPQGLTGSGDAVAGTIAGRNVLLVSWYYDGAAPDKGVRVAFADASSKAYRFALLVEPYMNGARPDFRAIPVHAGGLAWFGNSLYVADTTHGFRVFDMSRILEVATGVDAIGWDGGASVYRAHNYKYVIAQIGAYEQDSACSPRFSFTALDRATTPPSIVSGEYIDANPAGRLYRWNLDPATGRLAGGDRFVPVEAFYSAQSNIQGAVPAYGRWLLSSSAPTGGHGALYRVAPGFSATHAWSDSPEDLSIDVSTGELWGLSEAVGARYVYSMMVTNYQ
jgi:hypothetical protein